MARPRYEDMTPEQRKEVDDLNIKIDQTDWENIDPETACRLLIESVNLDQKLDQDGDQ
ncbi:MAG: hypothetical protein U5L00_00400 [Desulfovermiculus sp.]|nr:hypothetical protein [Desulfovermiculus sp.]